MNGILRDEDRTKKLKHPIYNTIIVKIIATYSFDVW